MVLNIDDSADKFLAWAKTQDRGRPVNFLTTWDCPLALYLKHIGIEDPRVHDMGKFFYGKRDYGLSRFPFGAKEGKFTNYGVIQRALHRADTYGELVDMIESKLTTVSLWERVKRAFTG
jgi:hypothetical protein